MLYTDTQGSLQCSETQATHCDPSVLSQTWVFGSQSPAHNTMPQDYLATCGPVTLHMLDHLHS